ncbi:unnamed protein product [Rotaria sordida]|uniref:Uncharacterized protein n=4 Tax=Rotaria sordida TaxID=392033 RepID=A0A815DP46_9BILA|nr:unnamed protein product [Rotaria sordida]
MLYPYTDDFVDCTTVSQKAKKEFAEVFHERLLIGESNYDPKSHFNGQQSNVAELRLPSSLQSYADKIGKVFDMVKFIENDWTRHGEHKCVYMSLAAIHDSQIKSTLQHARPDDGYAPTIPQIEQVSAEKGGASLIAAGFLMEGRLTRAKMAYLEYLGFGMQLVDDLQRRDEHVIICEKNALHTAQYAEFSISSCNFGTNEAIHTGKHLVPFLSTYMPNLQILRLWRPDDFPWTSIRPNFKYGYYYGVSRGQWQRTLHTPQSINEHVVVFEQDLSQLFEQLKQLVYLDIHGDTSSEKIEPYRLMVQARFPNSRIDIQISRFRLWM